MSDVPNVLVTVTFTIRFRHIADDAERAAVETIVRRGGGTVHWESDPAYARTYALIAGYDAAGASELRATSGGEMLEAPIIALAVSPSGPQALPGLLVALGGAGRPRGIVGCEAVANGLIVEWNLDVTPAELVMAIIDVEVSRVRASARIAVLSPLPLEWSSRIAADGLGAPEIAPDRVLEALLETHHVDH